MPKGQNDGIEPFDLLSRTGAHTDQLSAKQITCQALPAAQQPPRDRQAAPCWVEGWIEVSWFAFIKTRFAKLRCGMEANFEATIRAAGAVAQTKKAAA